jgi:serine/threonine-protein kinase
VAIKVLPEAFARDAERLARFEREAKVLASLNHPRIAQVYGLHEAAGLRFLAMELVRGEDLSQRLLAGPLPLEEALAIALQVADALETAHEHGVIHRDLKPANIVVTGDGEAKVLDFGLAKMFEASPWSGDPDRSPTLTSAGTQSGIILGTATYMSPEQARGKGLDRRTDIWSFGCVLYEMITGKRLFKGETISDTIALILQSQPDWSVLPPDIPPRLLHLLQRCLQRDPRQRLRDIGDARLEIEALRSGRDWLHPGPAVETTVMPAPRRRLFLLGAALFVGGALVATAIGALRSRGTPTDLRPLHVSVESPPGILPLEPRVSRDGRSVVFLGQREDAAPDDPERTQLYVRALDHAEARPVPGTHGATSAALSPDGRWVAYVAPIDAGSVQHRLFKTPVDGGAPPLVLAEWNDDWSPKMLWLDAHAILVATGKPVSLLRIPTDGRGPGEPLRGQIPADLSELFLQDLLPGGSHALATTYTWEQGYHDRTFALNLENGELTKILEDGSNPRWSSAGYVVFSRQHTLLAVAFDPGDLRTRGGPVTLADGLRTESAAAGAAFDLSGGNTLLFQPGGRVGSQRRLVVLGDDLQIQPWSQDRMAFQGQLAISPDERYVATTVMKQDDLLFAVWLSELDRPRLRQWQSMPGLDCNEPQWDGSSRRLYTNCQGTTEDSGVYVAPVDGSEAPRHLWHEPPDAKSSGLGAVHPNGRWLLVDVTTAEGATVLLVHVEASGGPFEAVPFLPERKRAWDGSFSPDGRWVSYLSDDAGRKELFLAPFDAEGQRGRPTLVTTLTTETNTVHWMETGEPGTFDLVYPVAAGRSERVRVHTTPSLHLGSPEPFLDVSAVRPRLVVLRTLGGGRFLAVQQDDEEAGTRRMDLVLNFSQELRRLAP